MSIGGYDTIRHFDNSTTYTIPYYDNDALYRIKIDKISLGDQVLNIPNTKYNKGQGSFVDSGTTLVYADKEIYDKFIQTFNDFCSKENNKCPGKQMINEQLCF